jgi:hypothetical protein
VRPDTHGQFARQLIHLTGAGSLLTPLFVPDNRGQLPARLPQIAPAGGVVPVQLEMEKRSPVKIIERTHEEATEALHAGRESCHLKEAAKQQWQIRRQSAA